MYAIIKPLKGAEFTLNNENIKQETGTQLSFFSEIQVQKEHFWVKYPGFLAIEVSIFNTC